MSTVSTQIFSRCDVPAKAGTEVTITVNQAISDDGTDMLQVQGPNKVKVRIEGPRVLLNTDDIAGVYPAAGSEESADEFLPHIAITRRTLPWERDGIDADAANPKPWLALVLFRESELKLLTMANGANNPPKGTPEAVLVSDVAAKDSVGHTALTPLGASTPVTVLYVRNDLWRAVRPHKDDLKYLAHVRRTTIGLQTKDTSIVICNRLPNAGAGEEKPEMHTACLISLENRADLYNDAQRPANNGVTALVVLHHWKFRPSKGGDFEQVIRSIRYQPNGGVLRFGNLTSRVSNSPAPLSGGFEAVLDDDGYFIQPMPYTQEGDVTWRSPLRPFKGPDRSEGFAIRASAEEFAAADDNTLLDYSHATAFELGRLLTLSNPGILEDLRNITIVIPEIIPPQAVNQMPPALQKPDWVSNPATWFEQPWSKANQVSMLKNEQALLEGDIANVEGINIPGEIIAETLADLGALPIAQIPSVPIFDFGTVSGASLGEHLADVENAAHGG